MPCTARFARLIICLLAAALLGWPNPAASADDKPLNVIFLFVDDWGWTDAACFGSDLYETPNMDRLAAEGVKFTNAYAACTVCSPTRAAVMTGMYPGRTNVTDWIPGHQRRNAPLAPPDWTQKLEHRHTTIAEALKQAGYRTAHIGKWHLTPRSNDPAVVSAYYPDRHGFDINVAGNQWGAPGSYFWPFKRSNRDDLNARVANFPKGGQEGDYLTDTLTTECLTIIEDYKDGPFYIYFPYYNVHTPIQGKPELVAHYQKKLQQNKSRKHRNPVYAAMVTAVDQSVGRIMAKVEELGIADRTAILLTGDNGGLILGRGKHGPPTNNAPLRAGKGSSYEGGVRVPLLAKWPGVTTPGSVSDEPVITPDYYPTILKMTGVKGDAGHNANVDGADLTPVLRNANAKLDRDAIYFHYPHYHPGGARPYSAVRARDWKLIEFYEDDHVELYNLARDIGEKNDLAQEMPDKAAALRAQLHAWRKAVAAQPPVKNPRASK